MTTPHRRGAANNIDYEITEAEQLSFDAAVSTELSDEQIDYLLNPEHIHSEQTSVMALHWHPQYVPIELALKRLDAMFPARQHQLVIPTQHNQLEAVDGYTGVELDCYSPQFDNKVQLLLHFKEENIREAPVLKEMIAHTFRYRAIQLIGLLSTVQTADGRDRLGSSAIGLADDDDLVAFVREQAGKLLRLIELERDSIPAAVIQNRLVKDYLQGLKAIHGERTIKRAQALIKAYKWMVKAEFDPDYYYRVEEIIEEARRYNGGVIVPHPENFWPVLLADYDVDGFEVWNPQSHRYTEFLIDVLNSQNLAPGKGERPLLMFMGDDTHLGDKVRDNDARVAKTAGRLHVTYDRKSEDKVNREVGYQPGWDELSIAKRLIIADESRAKVISEYKARLDG